MADENKKMKLEVEFDRDEVAGTFMLMGEKLTDERWEKLTEAGAMALSWVSSRNRRIFKRRKTVLTPQKKMVSTKRIAKGPR